MSSNRRLTEAIKGHISVTNKAEEV